MKIESKYNEGERLRFYQQDGNNDVIIEATVNTIEIIYGGGHSMVKYRFKNYPGHLIDEYNIIGLV